MIKRGCLTVSVFLILVLTMLGNAESPYSVDFDLRNMAGFNDNTITAEDIVAYIQEKYPNSPLLVEEGIGDCFISAGQNNNVNPAFLVATAELEGRFGTAGWASNNLQCHNTMGYDISDSGPGQWSCVDSWCAIIQRVASTIAIGDNYYTQSRFTVSQVRGKYATNPNSVAIAQYMNELYTFSLNRQTDGLDVPATGGSSTYEPQILNTTTPQLSGGSLPVTSVAFSPDGKKLAASASYGLTSIWDVESGTKLQELEQYQYYHTGLEALAFSPDGSKLAMGIDNEQRISIFDVESGTEIQRMRGDGTELIAFNPNGNKLITIDWYGTATLWDAKRGTELQNTASGGSDVTSRAISPDCSKLAICNGADRNTYIWDVESGTKLQELEHDHPVRFVAFDFDGSKLVTECYLESEVSIWDVESGAKLKEFDISEDTPLAFSSDGSKLAICNGADRTTYIWDVESGTKLQKLENYISPPRQNYLAPENTNKGVSFSLDGSKLAIGGSDGYTRIWNVKESSRDSDQHSPTKLESSDTLDLLTTTCEEESEETSSNFDGTPASTEKSSLSISIGAISLITAALFIKSKRDRL